MSSLEPIAWASVSTIPLPVERNDEFIDGIFTLIGRYIDDVSQRAQRTKCVVDVEQAAGGHLG